MATILSAGELAIKLKVSLKWLYQQLNKGRIAGSRKIGGSWFIDFDIFTATFHQPSKIERQGDRGRHGL